MELTLEEALDEAKDLLRELYYRRRCARAALYPIRRAPLCSSGRWSSRRCRSR